MWRPRDRERYIGGYDPEHEMPDPDRETGDRWQSGAYRHNARDSRFAYRMNPDAFERQFEGERGGGYGRPWDRDARDMNRGGGYDRGSNYGDYDRGGYGGGYRSSGGDYDRGNFVDGGYYDRVNRFGNSGNSDRGGWDRDRDRGYDSSYDRGNYGGGYGANYGGNYGSNYGSGYGGGYGGGYGNDRMSGPHYDRFSADRGRDHDRWNSGRDRGGYGDFRNDDWRRRR
jgi:hypothetical protein